MNPDQADDRRATMLPERWNVVKDKLFVALELEGAERTAYLEEIAGQDPELRLELDSLIASHEQASTAFLNQPAAHIATLITASQQDLIGRRLGPYQLVRQIGIGGMGEVYRAFRADDQYRKEVAIKLVRAGQGSGFILDRFKNERQILASLEHPNICRLLDGGTTPEGLPYFVMELIEGEAIDRYCSEHKSSVEHRLELFLQVCSAVQFAHQRLIVHRDIKPANILVTKEGQPKLLDLGIAKILDPSAIDSAAQVTLFQVLTPGYASPEQIKGEPITTASDVYSLGVVLYELLTGQSPYQITTSVSHEISRAVCEDEPRKPSTTVCENQDRPTSRESSGEKVPKRLQGDLDNIVLMALRKEPGRRYSSVEQFAEDIRRHLQNLPVLARQDSFRYRTSKFVLRHKAGVLAAAAAIIALLAGVGVILHEARIARQQAQLAQEQRRRAEARFNDVRKLANSLMFEVHDSIADLPGATQARKLIVEKSLQYLDGLSRESAGDVSLQRELAAAYERVGSVQGNGFQSHLGDPTAALTSYRKAESIRQAIAAALPENAQDQIALARIYRLVGEVLWLSLSDTRGSLDSLKKSVTTAQAAARLAPRDLPLLLELAESYEKLGDVQSGNGPRGSAGEIQEGLQNHRKSREMREQVGNSMPGAAADLRNLARAYVGVGDDFVKIGRREQALAYYRKAITIYLPLAQGSNNTPPLRSLSSAYSRIGDALVLSGKPQEAVGFFQKQFYLVEPIATADPSDVDARTRVILSRASIGNALVEANRQREGLGILRSSLAGAEKLSDSAGDAYDRTILAFVEVWVGEAEEKTG